MDSDEADTPEINYHAFMAQLARQKREKKREFKVGQKMEISAIKSRDMHGNIRNTDKSNFASVILRLVGAAFFVSLGIGALVYSVYKSPNDDQFRTTLPPTTPRPRLVNPFVNQSCASGTYIEERLINGTRDTELIPLSAAWYQYDGNQTAVLIQGKSNSDPVHKKTVALRNRMYVINYKQILKSGQPNCTLASGMNYSSFINSFGDQYMRYENDLRLVDYENIEAWGFAGRNWMNVNVYRYTSTNFSGEGQIMYGWKGYPYSDILNVRRYEFWFGSCMQQNTPLPNQLFQLPSSCP